MARTADTINFINTADCLDVTGNYQVIDAITGVGNGMAIADFFNARDNYGFLVINNTTVSAKKVTLVAGTEYPQVKQGNLDVSCPASKVSLVRVENPARFSQADGSLIAEFETGMTGFAAPVAFRTSLGL